jgi:murein DD-endopeptidase MepM/ murein hydrolase activator NlpD
VGDENGGKAIAKVGATGNVSEPQLHFAFLAPDILEAILRVDLTAARLTGGIGCHMIGSISGGSSVIDRPGSNASRTR